MFKVNKIKKYLVEVKNSSPLRVGNGDDEGINILLQDRHAVINGTTLAGIFNEFAEGIEKDIKELIFPPQDKRDISKVYFYDSLSEEEIEDRDFICRTHIRINEKLGSAEEGHLFNEYHISEGKTFFFRFDVMGLDIEENSYKKVCQYVEEFICRLSKGQISIGSKENFGFGKFDIGEERYYAKEFDLSKEEDLNKYLDINISEKKDLEPQDINLHNASGCEIVFKGYCEDGFIINDDYKDENKKQVGVTHTEVINKEEYVVIPSSTIKGIVRAYSSKIYRTLGKDISELYDIFGCSDDEVKRKKGKVTFNDCKIKKNEGNILKEYSRIMVDRFTGGNMNVFHNEVVVIPNKEGFEPLEFRISLKDYNEKVLALILLTLRDMGLGYVTIGSGSSVGYGRLTGKSINLITKDKKEFSIDFEGEALKGDVGEANRIIESLINGGV